MSESSADRDATPDFASEFRLCWSKLPGKRLFLSLFLLWVALFHFAGNSTLGYVDTHSLFGWMNNAYRYGADDQHGYLIPLLVLVLAWQKRDVLLAAPKKPWWPALCFFLIGLLFHLAGYLVQQPRVSIIGFFLGLYGLIGLTWGPILLKHVRFLMFLFVFCIPVSSLAEGITFPLRLIVTESSVKFSQTVLGIDVFRNGSQIFNGQGLPMYDVAPACSGIRSLTVLIALTMVYSYLTFESGWKRLLMILMSAPLAVAANTIRIITVIIIGEAFGQEAGAAIEQKFGFVTFGIALGLVFLLGFLLQKMPLPNRPSLA